MNPVIKTFLIRAGILFVVWLVTYHTLIVPNGRINAFLTDQVVEGTVLGLSILGFDSEGKDDVIYINKKPSVLVDDPCNGLELFALYAGFLLAFPGPIKYKALFIPSGLILIFLINIIREIALALNYNFFKETFEINHKYTYVFIVYIFIFLIWRYWLNRYSLIANMQRNED